MGKMRVMGLVALQKCLQQKPVCIDHIMTPHQLYEWAQASVHPQFRFYDRK
jgi:hypothetical protein